MATLRKYDILLIGATGYTGALTAQSIARNFSPDLKWAIAGRSETKLSQCVGALETMCPGCALPAIETVSSEEQIRAVIRQTKVCISVVNYAQIGDIVIDACVKYKCDYVDCAGDLLLARSWAQKYHQAAEEAGVALINGAGMLSAPQDVMSWAGTRELRRSQGVETSEFILAVKHLAMKPSGGTFESILSNVIDKKNVEEVNRSHDPWYLSPVKGTETRGSADALGLRHDADLGTLSMYSFLAVQNRAHVHRTWGLLEAKGASHGPNFQYNEYQSVSSVLNGIFHMLRESATAFLLSNYFTVRLLRQFMPAPGSGPDIGEAERSPVHMEGVSTADTHNGLPRVYTSFSFPSSSYHVTAVCLSQAAASLLYNRELEGDYQGGFLTPAMLGQDYIDRLKSAGATIEVRL